jgi:hypothetical protein
MDSRRNEEEEETYDAQLTNTLALPSVVEEKPHYHSDAQQDTNNDSNGSAPRY